MFGKRVEDRLGPPNTLEDRDGPPYMDLGMHWRAKYIDEFLAVVDCVTERV